MKQLASLNKYFKKYKYRLGLGIFFVTIANVFAILPPIVIRTVLDQVYGNITLYTLISNTKLNNVFVNDVMQIVFTSGLLLLAFALLRGVFMFFMRQTIIVMSRHIEYDQKNEIYNHYQNMDANFFKVNATGDLMSRMSEDVSRVRMYTGPAIMYTLNLLVLTTMSIWGMLRVSWELTLYALFFLPILAYSMIKINSIINKKSGKIQTQLGKLTSLAQESYSGIKVVKSYVLEKEIHSNFEKASKAYRRSNLALAKTEAMYTPLMGLFIGLSLIVTVFIGGRMAINNEISVGNIAEFIIYISMLTFPVSTLGWTSSIIQRAAASQKRLNDFLDIKPQIKSPIDGNESALKGNIEFQNVSFKYPDTGIVAINNLSLNFKPGQKIAILGKTGSGKSTLVQLLLRMYEADAGTIKIDNIPIQKWNLTALRNQISNVPQEVYLFSDTIENNIKFGSENYNFNLIEKAAQSAYIHDEIKRLPNDYETLVGERGVMLSGGQKQRVSIARALYKPHQVLVLDDCISAVDASTEQHILNNLKKELKDQTVIIITHRIFKNWDFDQIIVLDNGAITEQGNHEELMKVNGFYKEMYDYQVLQ